jgi:hypothetical protein
MIAFRTEDDLRRALDTVGLSALADDVVATSRPGLIFVRRQRQDDALPVGTSKIFGLPDLPPGIAWPHRQPLLDCAARARKLRERRTRERKFYASLGWANADRNAAEDHYDELRIASFDRSFPLAPVAQFDLEALSCEQGFDADLPRHGILSLFEDLTVGNSIHVYWFDMPAAALERRTPPGELVALSDTRQPDDPWAGQTKAEVLEPHSTLTVPFHWADAAGSHRSEMLDFLDRSPLDHHPTAEETADEPAGCFGDRLGGWPAPIHSNPESSFEGDKCRRIQPGEDRIRHLFSWGGESYSGTRHMHAPFNSDGTTYVMIRRDDLVARRFNKAGASHQFD